MNALWTCRGVLGRQLGYRWCCACRLKFNNMTLNLCARHKWYKQWPKYTLLSLFIINFLSQLILVLLVGIKIPNKVYTLNGTLAHLKYNKNYCLNV